MNAILVGSTGIPVFASVLEVRTRDVYREQGHCCIRMTSFGLQLEAGLAVPGDYVLRLGEGVPLRLHVSVCLELPAGGFFVSGEVVTQSSCEADLRAGYAV